MYSIIETAIENGLHPYRYVEFLLKTLLGSTTNDLENLLPWSEELPTYCRVGSKMEASADGKKQEFGFHDRLRSRVS